MSGILNRSDRVAAVTLVSLAALVLAGCQGSGLRGAAPATGTNAPAAGFVNMTDGSEEDFILNVGRRTYFAAGSAVIDETARTTLDKQAQWLQRHPQWLLKVQGFADDPGTPEQNAALSKQRAEAVLTYLASRGIDRRRMWARGYGQERMVRDCPDISCTSQNRRVISNLRTERET